MSNYWNKLYKKYNIEEEDVNTSEINNNSESLTFGEKIADKVASFGGSWRFIFIFMIIMAGWITYNSISIYSAIDPFPYILLNLLLSCLAAIQAPIIMMSQNRLAAQDRKKAEKDFQVNVQAEKRTRVISAQLKELLERGKND